jgi:hypothetical protein
MASVYPPYHDYQAATARVIPIIMLQPGEEVPTLTA